MKPQQSLFEPSQEAQERNSEPIISGPQAFFDFSNRMFKECITEEEARLKIRKVLDENPNLLDELNRGIKNTFSRTASRTYGPHD